MSVSDARPAPAAAPAAAAAGHALITRDKALALRIAPLARTMERGRLRFFAQTIGLADPVYLDTAAAQRAGYRDIPVPLTFLGNALELDIPEPLSWLTALGADLNHTAHAEQTLIYHRMAFAGDDLVLERSISDVYAKKGGALQFVVKRTAFLRGDELVAEALCSIALRQPTPAPAGASGGSGGSCGADASGAAAQPPAQRPLTRPPAAPFVPPPAFAPTPLAEAAGAVVGTELPTVHIAPISRRTLALFAGASGDHMPVHIDLDAARARGRDDVFVHGMLSMAYLGRILTQWVPQPRVRRYAARFVAVAPIHAQPTATGRVTALAEDGSATVELALTLADGTVVVRGEAEVALRP